MFVQMKQRVTSEYNFIFFGPTGAGKSFIIEMLYNKLQIGCQPIAISSDSATSVTDHTIGYSVMLESYTMNLIDTPGFGDTGDKDIFNLINVNSYMSGLFGVNCVIIVVDASRRLSCSLKTMFEYIDSLFEGEDISKSITICLNRISPEIYPKKLKEYLTEIEHYGKHFSKESFHCFQEHQLHEFVFYIAQKAANKIVTQVMVHNLNFQRDVIALQKELEQIDAQILNHPASIALYQNKCKLLIALVDKYQLKDKAKTDYYNTEVPKLKVKIKAVVSQWFKAK